MQQDLRWAGPCTDLYQLHSTAVQVTSSVCEVLVALAQWLVSQMDATAGPVAQSIIAGELRALVEGGPGGKGSDAGSPVDDCQSCAGGGSPSFDAGVLPLCKPCMQHSQSALMNGTRGRSRASCLGP